MRTELLAPAGDLERLKVAVQYGAEAVYFGGKQFSLRARASNFSLDDIKEAVEYAHNHGVKVYVTVNIIPHNSDFEGLSGYLTTLQEFGADAIICASAAILELCKKAAPNLEVHVSTQQTALNSAALSYWRRKQADRIVLAREVSLKQASLIKKNTDLPLELFIHGGMCASFSGRCTISNALTNRDANRGGCAQSCRWNYHLWHEDQLLDREDCLFSMGSKDMCTIDCFEEVLKLQPASLKIEGRMKTAFYIACVVKGYRFALDCFRKQGYISERQLEYSKALINLASNRDWFLGFYRGLPGKSAQLYNDKITTANQVFVANVKAYDPESKSAIIEVRNNFRKGDMLAILSPKGKAIEFRAEKLLDGEGNELEVANKPMQLLRIEVPLEVNEYSFIFAKGKGQ